MTVREVAAEMRKYVFLHGTLEDNRQLDAWADALDAAEAETCEWTKCTHFRGYDASCHPDEYNDVPTQFCPYCGKPVTVKEQP